MPEYIEREETIINFGFDWDDIPPTRKEFVEFLKRQPSVDVAPVVHGEWMLRHVGHGHYWECSVCHKNPCIYVTEDTNYCPNCGAKMDNE